MSCLQHHIIKIFRINPVLLEVVEGDFEVLFPLEILDHSHRASEADPVSQPRFFNAPFDVVPKHLPWCIGSNGPYEVLLKCVVSKIKAFFGTIGPEGTVHAACTGSPY